MEQTQNPKQKRSAKKIIAIVIVLLAFGFAAYGLKASLRKSPDGNNQQTQKIEVSLKINTGSNTYEYTETVNKDTTVLDLMKTASDKEKFELSYQNSSAGAYIEEIYGVKNDTEANKFWLFSVNGQSSNVGASSYKLSPGDVVEWNYTSM